MPTATFTRSRLLQGLDTILAWVEFYHVDAAGMAKTYRWAGTTIADPVSYQGGRKEARVLTFGHYELALSDRQGRLDGATLSFELNDLPDASGNSLLRGFLGEAAQVALRNVEVVIKMISDVDRRAGHDPIPVFRGLVKDYKARAGFTFAFDCQDWLSARVNQTLTLFRVGTDFPGAPAASRDRRGPLWYGKVSDEPSTAAPPSNASESAKGVAALASPANSLAGAGLLGITAPAGTAAAEAAGGSLNLGDVPADTYYVMATRIVGGVESDPFPFYGMGSPQWPAGAVSVTLTGSSKKITASCTNDGADSYRFYIGYEYFGLARWSHYLESAAPNVEFTKVPAFPTESNTSNITPGGKLPTYTAIWYYQWTAVFDDGETAMGGLWQVVISPYRRPARTVVTPLVGPTPNFYYVYRRAAGGSYDRRWRVEITETNGDGNIVFDDDQLDTGVEYISGVAAPKGVAPGIYLGQFQDLDGATWEGFAIAAHAVKTVGNLYLDGVEVDSGRYGVDVTAPDHTNYAAFWGATRYRAVGTHRWTVVYFRGPDGSALAEGTKSLTANFDGIESTGDGTGTLLTSIYDQIGHFLDNFVLPQSQYAGGNWGATPTWADGTSKRDTASFTSTKTAAAVVITAGDSAAWGVLNDDPILDILADRMIDGDTAYGFTKAGQVRIVLQPPDPSRAAALTVTDVLDILDGTFEWEDDGNPSRFFNKLAYEYRPVYDESGGITYENTGTAEDAAFQTRYKQVLDAPSGLSFNGRRGPGASGQIASRHVDRAKRPPRTYALRLPLYGLTLEVGDAISVTHPEGPGATGIADRLVFITRLSPMLDLCEIAVTAFDVADIVSDGNLLLEEFMASRTLGGSRENDFGEQANGTYDIPEWRPVRINWDQIPSGWVVRARVWVKNDNTATQTPRITDLADVDVAVGAASGAVAWTEQLIVITRPGGGGEQFYKLRSTLAGAAALRVWMFGEIEIVSS